MAGDGSWKEELERERAAKNDFMARHPESPFVLGRVPFHDLVYFDPDPKFRVAARLERLPAPAEAYLRTTQDNQAVMRYLGDLVFSVDGRSLKLRVYHAGEGVGTSVFVPFRDRTTGKETSAAGRYLTLELNEQDEYELDFNRAFNPYCAYTDDYECSFPPADNDLPVAIRAGERVWASEPTAVAPVVRVTDKPVARRSHPRARRPVRRVVRARPTGAGARRRRR
jgi:uncharacterized protein (DUF1684 family)